MIAYKGAQEGKKGCFWSVYGKQTRYEVGETYETTEQLELCKSGFHFCKTIQSINLFYLLSGRRLVVFEIDVLGDIIEGKDKSVTNKFKINRIVPKAEYFT